MPILIAGNKSKRHDFQERSGIYGPQRSSSLRRCNPALAFFVARRSVTFLQPGLFMRRGRRHGESLFHWGIVRGLWFRQLTQDVKLTNLQTLPPRSENRFKGETRRLSS